MKKKTLINPHDKLFRASMQYPKVAQEFLEFHLPEFIKKGLDFKTLKTCPETFIDEELKLSQSDVLIKANLFGKTAFIYTLCEHQSIQELLEIVHDQLPSNVEGGIMTLAEKLRDEGWNKGLSVGLDKGRTEGRNEGFTEGQIAIAKRMLAEGSDIAFVLKVTQLPIETVKALQSKK